MNLLDPETLQKMVRCHIIHSLDYFLIQEKKDLLKKAAWTFRTTEYFEMKTLKVQKKINDRKSQQKD